MMIKNILCVDDDDIAQFYTSSVIEDASFVGHKDSVYNGQMAIEYFTNLENKTKTDNALPELILLDLNMPVMDGWEFLAEFSRKFSEKFRTVKVAIVSSSVNPSDFAKAKDYPFVIDFISKPITVEKLQNINNEYFDIN